MGYQNFYATKLTNDIGAADTSIVVDQAPTATSGRLVLEARNPTQREVIKYTGVSGNTLTGVLRGQGGTSAKSHLKSSLVEMNATSEDLQDLYDAFNSFVATNTDWRNIVNTLSYVSGGQKGNNYSDLKLAGIDARTFLSKGMKLSYNRPSAPPTQVMTFNNLSSQSASRVNASVAGSITSLNQQITIEALIRPDKYSANTGTIIARRNNPLTAGWGMRLTGGGVSNTKGCIDIYGGSGSQFDTATSIARIPLTDSDDYIMVSATLDMATGTATIYYDGQQIALNYINSAATSMTNAGDIAIGKCGAGADEYFSGDIAEVRVWSTIRTATQIRDNLHTPMVGNESGLVGYWRGDGNFNDLTSNANHLTANNGAVATTLAHPWKTTEFAEIQSVSYSAPDSTISVYGKVPNQVLSSPKWSAVYAPLNYPDYLNKPKKLYDTQGWRVIDFGTYREYHYAVFVTGSTSPSGRLLFRLQKPDLIAQYAVTGERLRVVSCSYEGNFAGHASASAESMTTSNVDAYVSSMYSGGSLTLTGYIHLILTDKVD